MKDQKVKEIMVSLSDYATVSEDETIDNAIRALKQAQQDTKYKYKHRAVLVYGKEKKITGKVSIFDMLKALEPKYRHIEQPGNIGSVGLSRFGLNYEFLNSLIENLNLWDDSLEVLVKKASRLKVKEIMYSPSEGEYVDENASIAEAIHQFVLGCHQSLLVLKDNDVVGVLRLTDIFGLLCDVVD